MKKIILKVMKIPVAGGLAFYVLENTIMSAGFPWSEGYFYLEYYEKPSYPYENRVGWETKIISLEETDNDVFFEIHGDYQIGLLSGIADEITSLGGKHNQHYALFLQKIHEHLDVTKL